MEGKVCTIYQGSQGPGIFGPCGFILSIQIHSRTFFLEASHLPDTVIDPRTNPFSGSHEICHGHGEFTKKRTWGEGKGWGTKGDTGAEEITRLFCA